MIRLEHNLNSGQARELLRKFRDLNLGPCGIEIAPHERVEVRGCLSLDHPVERGVRYRMVGVDGSDQSLRISWEGENLHLTLRNGLDLEAPIALELDADLGCDRFGRVASTRLNARLDPVAPLERELEHFLRRIVRAVYAA
jgi:hypothetical protein